MYPYNIRRSNEKKISTQNINNENSENDRQISNDTEPETLMMLKEAMQSASDNAAYYNSLALQISNPNDKEIVLRMYLNKCKEGKIISEIYSDLTGERLITPEPAAREISDDMSVNLSNAIIAETNNVEFYRSLLFTLLNIKYRDMVYEIITDTQNNTALLNYLYSKWHL